MENVIEKDKVVKKRKPAKKAVEAPAKVQLVGLTDAEVETRIANGQLNGEQDIKTKTIGQIIKTNAFTFFNAMFIALGIILIFFVEKNLAGFANFGFLFVVLINFTIGLLQELSAKRTIDKLSLLSSPKVTVLRNGKPLDIKLSDIVLDDIMLLGAGKQICADSVVLDGSIEVNESMITGESEPIVKNVGDELLSGSFVVSGNASVKAIHVGKDNYTYKISHGAKYIKPTNSVILKSVRGFVKAMAIVILPLGIASFCLKYFWHNGNLNNTVITVIGALVGMIPSGLMLLTTGVFCISVVRLSSYKALSQDLYCTEILARVDVLCLDKTGTITTGEMEVMNIIPTLLTEEDIINSLKNFNAALNESNPTAKAIEKYTTDVRVTENPISVIPFSSKRKWSAAQFKDSWLILGAAEFIFKKLNKNTQHILNYHAEKGNRVLVFCMCKEIKNEIIPSTVRMIGYIIISDQIRYEAYDTLKYFDEQGVAIKIISGDNHLTVKSIAKRAGVADYESCIDASTLKTEEALLEAVDKYTIFGRVTPDQKLAIVKALKAKGHTVGMTGDGVNDVLALKEADCSIAMAEGSDAAKNVSQIVLLDSNFRSMPRIVAEGRRSINNLERSSSLFLVKTGYNFLLVLVFMLLQSDLPFAPKHYTLLGMVTIGIPSYVLALEPNKERVTGRFLGKVISNALPASLTTVIAVVSIVLLAGLFPNLTEEQISTMCLIVTATVGFCYLAKVSYPFNFLRVFLMVLVITIFISAFFADFQFFNLTEFYGLTTEINKEMIIIMVPTAIISVPLFIGIYSLGNLLQKHSKWSLIDKSLEKLNITK